MLNVAFPLFLLDSFLIESTLSSTAGNILNGCANESEMQHLELVLQSSPMAKKILSVGISGDALEQIRNTQTTGHEILEQLSQQLKEGPAFQKHIASQCTSHMVYLPS